MSETIELIRFRLQPGKTSANWLEANEKINAWVERQPGFRFRSLSEAEDGEWVDVIYWENMAASEKAGESFHAEMGELCAALIAQESVSVSRSRVHVMQQG